MEKKKFVFVAHWVETWNWLLWWSKDLHQNPQHAWRWMVLWPVFFIVSLVYILGKRGYDIVDRFQFNGRLEGRIVLIRSFSWQFFVNTFRNKIRQRILDAVLELQETTDVIGLGALAKAEWLTRGGKRIVEKLGDKLKVPIVHGDTLTAATVIRRVLQFNLSPVFLTGATSKIGRAVALDLASRGITVKMFTESEGRFSEIRDEAEESNRRFLVNSFSLSDGKDCPLWITGKAIPAGKNLTKHLSRGTVIVNFSVPNPVSEHLQKARSDLRFCEGGLLAFDSNRSTQSFNMRLWAGETYACHAGTMVHADRGWTHHEVGQVDLAQISVVWEAAEELGFFLSPLPAMAPVKVRWLKPVWRVWQAVKHMATLLF